MRKNTYFPELLTPGWGAKCCMGNSLGASVNGNITKFRDLWDAKYIIKKYVSKKTITQDIFTWFEKFAYIHGIAKISLFARKNTRCGSTFFYLKTTHHNPNHQTTVSIPMHRIHQWAKNGTKICLSLRKNLIKDCCTFILGRIIIQIKHN